MWENVRDSLLNKEDFKKQFPKRYIWYHSNYLKKKKKKGTDRQKRLQYALKKIQESRHQNDNNGYLRKLSLCAFLCFFSFILLNNEHAPFAIKKCQDCVLF